MKIIVKETGVLPNNQSTEFIVEIFSLAPTKAIELLTEDMKNNGWNEVEYQHISSLKRKHNSECGTCVLSEKDGSFEVDHNYCDDDLEDLSKNY
jgi:hypothetical protein